MTLMLEKKTFFSLSQGRRLLEANKITLFILGADTENHSLNHRSESYQIEKEKKRKLN